MFFMSERITLITKIAEKGIFCAGQTEKGEAAGKRHPNDGEEILNRGRVARENPETASAEFWQRAPLQKAVGFGLPRESEPHFPYIAFL